MHGLNCNQFAHFSLAAGTNTNPRPSLLHLSVVTLKILITTHSSLIVSFYMLTISCIYFIYIFFSLQLFPTLSSAAPLTWPFPPQAASKAGARLTCWPSPLRGPSPVTRVSTPSGTKAACFRESDVSGVSHELRNFPTL